MERLDGAAAKFGWLLHNRIHLDHVPLVLIVNLIGDGVGGWKVDCIDLPDRLGTTERALPTWPAAYPFLPQVDPNGILSNASKPICGYFGRSFDGSGERR
jgi:hypothetical protein